MGRRPGGEDDKQDGDEDEDEGCPWKVRTVRAPAGIVVPSMMDSFQNVAGLGARVCGSGHHADLEDVQELGEQCSSATAARLTTCCFTFGAVIAKKRFTTRTQNRKRRLGSERKVLQDDGGDLGAQGWWVRGLQGCVERSVSCLAPGGVRIR